MKLWLDCEWNGFKGELISMALVDEHEHQWYEILPCMAPQRWVAENVIPRLGMKPSITKEQMRQSLCAFLRQYARIHVIADWPEDIERFCELLIIGPGLRLDTPPLTMEVRRDLNSDASAIPHNALEDAKALKAMDLVCA